MSVPSVLKGAQLMCNQCKTKHEFWMLWAASHDFNPAHATRVQEYRPKPSILDLLLWG